MVFAFFFFINLLLSKKYQMADQAQIYTTQDLIEPHFMVDLSKNVVQTGLYFIWNPDGRPCDENHEGLYVG